MRIHVADLHRMMPALEDQAIALYESSQSGSESLAIGAIKQGLAYAIVLKNAVIACAPLPDISKISGDQSLTVPQPVIKAEFQYRGLACVLVPLPVVHAHLYLPEVKDIRMHASTDLRKAMQNMGFSNSRGNDWTLPLRRAYRSASEILPLCGTQIVTTTGDRGTMRLFNRDPGMMLSLANKEALTEVARAPIEISAEVAKPDVKPAKVFGATGYCRD